MANTYTQDGQVIMVTTPLGQDALLLEELTGSEGVSKLFSYRLDMLALAGTTVAFDKILGQSVTVTIQLPNKSKRYLNGIVSRFAEGPQLPAASGNATFIRYRAELVPQFWLLTRKVQSRIFQHLSVLDILKKVLTGLDVAWQVQGTFDPRDYCVQYRESDFAFASRLMEEEGIFYFFQHSNGSHKMVVANTPQSHVDLPGPAKIIYETVSGGTRPDDRVLAWEKSQELRSGKWTMWDYCFEMADKQLNATQSVQASAAVGTQTLQLKAAGNDQLEIYDYPGGYAQRYDGIASGGGDQASQLQKIFSDGTRTVGIRMQQETAPAVIIKGQSNCRQLVTGYKFTLEKHFDANGSYVLTSLTQKASIVGTYSTGAPTPLVYENSFECLPAAIPFRPPGLTLKPTIKGTQTAVVVGPSGQEIFTDKYSRVKVQFHWDRTGQNNADSSCWIRVATPWAGQQWGLIHIPRIGQEVVVAFEEGDPDQPIIVGSVYNSTNMPPYTLPDNMTQSGLKTRSSQKGTAQNANELRFEDKKDSELILFHAEKDFTREVENNDTLTVGSSNAPDGSQTITIYNNRTETIQTGNDSLTISKGNRTETISEGNDSLTISKGTRTVAIKSDHTRTVEGKETITVTNNRALEVKQGNYTVTVDQGEITLKASSKITLQVGGSSIVIESSKITLQTGGSSVAMEASSLTAKSPTTTVNGDGQLALKGGVVQIN